MELKEMAAGKGRGEEPENTEIEHQRKDSKHGR